MPNIRSKFCCLIIVLLSLFALLPTVYDIFVNPIGVLHSIVYFLSRLGLIVLVVFLLNFVFPLRIVFYLVTSFTIIIVPIELVHLLTFDSFITLHGLIALIQTNIGESFSFMRGLEWFLILFPISAILLLIGIRSIPMFRLNNQGFLKSAILLVGLFFVVICSFYLQIRFTPNYHGTTFYSLSKGQIVKKYPLNLLYRSYELYIYKKGVKQYAKRVADFRFNGMQESNSTDSQVYILVIGESARVSNYQIFGYERANTPRLDAMNNLILFPDFYSTGNTTNTTIPLIITRATAQEYHLVKEEKSIFTLFKEAGFSTFWISNQVIAERYEDEPDTFYSCDASSYDEQVLPVLDSVLNDRSNNKKFILINLFGNHYGSNPYPDDYQLYSPSLEDSKNVLRSPKFREYFINSYDNSVYYQDFVLSNIIERLEQEQIHSFVFFTSDHGESLFDEPDNFYGHGSAKLTKEQINIPVFIWYSDLFKDNNETTVKNIEHNRLKKLSSDFTFHTIADMASIRFDSLDLSLSFAQEDFVEPEERFAILDFKCVAIEF